MQKVTKLVLARICEGWKGMYEDDQTPSICCPDDVYVVSPSFHTLRRPYNRGKRDCGLWKSQSCKLALRFSMQ